MSTPYVYLWIHITLDIDVEIMQKSNMSNNVKIMSQGKFLLSFKPFLVLKAAFPLVCTRLFNNCRPNVMDSM